MTQAEQHLTPQAQDRSLLPNEQQISVAPENRVEVAPDKNALTAVQRLETFSNPLAISDGGEITFEPEAKLTLSELLLDAVNRAVHKRIIFRLADGSDRMQTYTGLVQEARCLLGGLKRLGLQPGDNVILLLEKNHDVVPVFWACMLGGFAPLIMEVPDCFDAENRTFGHVCELFRLLDARLVITDADLHADVNRLRDALPDHSVVIAIVDELAQNAPELEQHTGEPDDTAFFCLTSGSTGMPKCVPLTHRNALVRSQGTNAFNAHDASDVYLNWLPFDHIGSLGEHIRCIAAGCDMVYLYKEDILSNPLNMLHTIDKYRITHTWGPNFIYALMRDALAESTADYGWDLSSIRFMISGGEPVSSQTMQDFLTRTGVYGFPATGCRPSFGMAEVCAGITYGEPSNDEPLGFFWTENQAYSGEDVRQTAPEAPGAKPFANLGRPIPGVSIRIVDQQHQVLPEDTVGHVHLKGDLVLNNYYKDPDFNAQCFLDDGWFDTGDLGFLSDSRLALTGRAKAMLIINGSNYYSHEIEGVVAEIEGVETSFTAACAVRDSDSDSDSDSDTDKLAIFFHALTDDKAALRALIRQVRQAIVNRIHLNPDYIIPVDKADIPKTPIGKIQRTLLAERFNQGLFEKRLHTLDRLLEHASTLPQNALESVLAEVWQDVLGVKAGIHDNFFDLGGSSIKAVMVMNKFQERIGGIFHPVSLFDAPTIAELAQYFEHNYPALFQAAEAASAPDDKPLTTAQIDHMRDYLAQRLCSASVHTDSRSGKNRRAIFVLSPARSGSTLLRVILAGNPQLFSPPELYLLGFTHLKERAACYAGRLAFLREGVIRAIIELKACTPERAEQLMHALEAQDLSVKELFARMQAWAGERMLVDKTPPYAFNPTVLQRLEEEFADPLYIHLMRHPAGMVASFEEARVDLAVDVHGDADGMSLTARQKGELWWLISHQNILRFLQDIPEQRRQLIRFEDLVTEPEATVTQLCDFLGVDFHPDMLEPQKEKTQRMTDGAHQLSRLAGDPKFHTHQGIATTAADRWKEIYHKDFLCDQTWQIARDYGYRFERHGSLADFQITPDPTRRHQPFPLTDIQQAYWAGRIGNFELGGYSVHSYTEIDSDGLDVRRLHQAWQKMIERHEMLRTIILSDGHQQILKDIPTYNVRVLDLRNLDSAGVQAELATTRERMSHRVFALDQWPLFEIFVSRVDERHYRVHLSFDAILFDARSRYIIFSEFRQFYEQPDLALAPFELSFRDYVLMEEALKDSPLFAQARDYWLQQIPELPGTPELPLTINPATLEQPRFIQKNHFMPRSDWSRLKALAAQEQITASCLLLTAFSDVVRIWNKQESFTINLTAYNRQPLHREVNDIIGDFTSIILLGIDGPDNHSFITRARNLQKRLWDNMNHNQFSGIQVLRELSRRNDHKPGAQMPVVFTSVLGDEIQVPDQQTTDWLGDVVFNVAQTPQIWFDHVAFEEGGGLLCRWNIVDQLFPEGLMDAMFDAYLNCLQRLQQDPRAWQEPWPQTAKSLVAGAQRAQRTAANATDAPVPAELLHTLFARQVAQQAHQPAVIAADKTLSYQELYRLSNQIGHRLQRTGVQPNQLVAVVMDKGWQQVAAVMGILASGAAYLPLDPELPTERFHFLLEFGQVDTVLTTNPLRNRMNWPTNIRLVCVDDASLAEESTELPDIRQQPEDLAYVIFTSGSTGLPKGVMIDHRGAVNTVLDINARFQVGPQDRTLALSALNFDLSVYDVFGLLAAGGAIVLPRAADIRHPPQWVKLVNDYQVTIWNTVPAFMGLLTEYVESHPETSADSLRLIMMSGDWIPISLPERIGQRFKQPEVISLGGATEASIWSILYPITQVDPNWKSIPYGKPMLNQQFHVLNAALEDCPVWVPGQLYIGGAGLARGYWRDPEKTAKAFINHPRTGERLYCTGDLGRYLPDGNIEFLGREDFQVKIQGYRVEIGEIETALIQHPSIKTVVVDARGEVHAEKQLVAYFVPELRATVQAAELRTFLQQKLPAYMVPAVYIPIPDLPLSSNGKVDKKSLPEPSTVVTPEPAAVANDTQATPESGIAGRIHGIVEEVLDQTGIGYADDVFNLGATSIHMMRIVNRVETILGFRPPIDEFYTTPTVRGLVTAYEQTRCQATHLGSGAAVSHPAIYAPAGKVLEAFDVITDPDERAAFKAQQHGIRQLAGPSVPLANSDDLSERYATQRSHRYFSTAPIALADFGEFLSCLHQETRPSQAKYLYGSAGGLYPVQAYLYVKPGRVESLKGGVYYYHPVEHRLVLLSNTELDARIYNPHINRPVYKRAAFAVFLISKLAAIAPMYKELALHFSTLEAGLISQLLRTHAPDTNLGVCEIGELDFNRVSHLFDLDDTHMLVHSLVGGVPEENSAEEDTAFYKGVFGTRPGPDVQTREVEVF